MLAQLWDLPQFTDAPQKCYHPRPPRSCLDVQSLYDMVMSDIGMHTAFRQSEANERPGHLPQQAQLPSFRDIIPPHLHTPIDTRQVKQSDFEPDILSPSTQNFSVASRSIVASPAQSHGSSMPSLAEGLEEISVRCSEPMFNSQPQCVSTMDRASSWMPVSHYQSMSTSLAHAMPNAAQMVSNSVKNEAQSNCILKTDVNPAYHIRPESQLTEHMKIEANHHLPPLRDSDHREGFDQAFGSVQPQLNYATSAASYPTTYGSMPPRSHDMGANGSIGKPVAFDTSACPRYATSYPPNPRSFQNTDYSRFLGSSYDPYRYDQNYRTGCLDVNYHSYATVGSQSSSCGMQAEFTGNIGRKRRGNLPKEKTDILKAWFADHLDCPYPTDEDKQMFIQKTGFSIAQISNWFINARRRHWPNMKHKQRQNAATAVHSNSTSAPSERLTH